MKRFGALAAVGLVATLMSPLFMGSAGAAIGDPRNAWITVNGGSHPHEFSLTYSACTDGVVTFSGTGLNWSHNPTFDFEKVSGALDLTAGTFTWTSAYYNDPALTQWSGYTWDLAGPIVGAGSSWSFADGTLTFTNSGVTAHNTSGSFAEVPSCDAPPPATCDGPAAPAVANKILREAGVSRKSLDKGVSAVALHMGAGTDFDGNTKCSAGYAPAIQAFLQGLGYSV